MAKTKKNERVVISKAYLNLLEARAQFLDDLFSFPGELTISVSDFADYERLEKGSHKIDPDDAPYEEQREKAERMATKKKKKTVVKTKKSGSTRASKIVRGPSRECSVCGKPGHNKRSHKLGGKLSKRTRGFDLS